MSWISVHSEIETNKLLAWFAYEFEIGQVYWEAFNFDDDEHPQAFKYFSVIGISAKSAVKLRISKLAVWNQVALVSLGISNSNNAMQTGKETVQVQRYIQVQHRYCPCFVWKCIEKLKLITWTSRYLPGILYDLLNQFILLHWSNHHRKLPSLQHQCNNRGIHTTITTNSHSSNSSLQAPHSRLHQPSSNLCNQLHRCQLIVLHRLQHSQPVSNNIWNDLPLRASCQYGLQIIHWTYSLHWMTVGMDTLCKNHSSGFVCTHRLHIMLSYNYLS